MVIFKSYKTSDSRVSNLGANRKRIEELRKRAGGVFSIMGNGLMADSYNGGVSGKSNGVFGQLKAFYEMNSIHKDGNSLFLTPVSRSIKASIHSTIHKVTTNGRRMIDGLEVSNKSAIESVAGGAHSEELKMSKKEQ